MKWKINILWSVINCIPIFCVDNAKKISRILEDVFERRMKEIKWLIHLRLHRHIKSNVNNYKH